MQIKFSREWAMPSADTFSVNPIGLFVNRYMGIDKISIDPFARNKIWATYTNDLNPDTKAEYHMDAIVFLAMLKGKGVKADIVLFDPPYSPRQVSECYNDVGRKATSSDTSSKTWSNWKNAIHEVIKPGGIVLSFGWNSCGMGLKRGFTPVEILLVCHGGAHNDTICMAEVYDGPGLF